jgi:serine/threonine-protein kinase
MPSIIFECPDCKSNIAADSSLCGNVIICRDCGRSVVIPIPGIQKGLEIGGFLLKDKLGAGGMGEVWLAYHVAMDRHVALKILSPKLTSNKEFLDRFIKEAKNSAKLNHPNIVTAYHAGSENGIYYLAISYVDGKNLRERIDSGEMIPERESLLIAKSIIDGLRYAWDEFKIVHRDIKPANIIIDKKGVTKVLDLGISKSLDEDSSLTMTGVLLGTPFYMSPEQVLGDKNIDFRADIYSLGATLYHILTGTVPFDASTVMAIVSRHLRDPLPSARERNPALSKQCCALLEVMMAKKREERQQSWIEVRNDVDLVLQGKYPKTPPPKNEQGNRIYPVSSSEEITTMRVVAPQEKTVVVKTACNADLKTEAVMSDNVNEVKSKTGSQKPKSRISYGVLLIIFLLLAFLACAVTGTALILWNKYASHDGKISPKGVSEANAVKLDDDAKKDSAKFTTGKVDEFAKLPGSANSALETLKDKSVPKEKDGEGTDNQISIDLGGGVKMELLLVQPGKFMMGDKESQHEVTLTKPFWIGKFEVTQEQYEKVTGVNPSGCKYSGRDAPVEQVTWSDAAEFCRRLSEKEGKALPKGYVFRLPTEAEWEYAARGGRNSNGFEYSGSNTPDDVAWSRNNSGGKTNPVGRKKPNELGLYDMSGNVWEWCNDLDGAYLSEPEKDPMGAKTGFLRVNRGGSWLRDARLCRSAIRGKGPPDICADGLGFRLAIGHPVPGMIFKSDSE